MTNAFRAALLLLVAATTTLGGCSTPNKYQPLDGGEAVLDARAEGRATGGAGGGSLPGTGGVGGEIGGTPTGGGAATISTGGTAGATMPGNDAGTSETGGAVGGVAGGGLGLGGSSTGGMGTGGVLGAGAGGGAGSAGYGGAGGTGMGGEGGNPQRASCRSLPKTCGPAGAEDCCTLTMVPGGSFNRGNDATLPATVSPFKMDRFEVTVGRFRKFVEAGMGTAMRPPIVGSGKNFNNSADAGWQGNWIAALPADTAALMASLAGRPGTWTDVAGATETMPMLNVTWVEAYAFCIWDGGRMPTEAEWQMAAIGGNEQREFAWPAASDCTTTGTYSDVGCCDYMTWNCMSQPTAVGKKHKGDARWGQADLVGNAAEWVVDQRIYNPGGPSRIVPCDNCAAISNTLIDQRLAMGRGFGQPTGPNSWTNASSTIEARPTGREAGQGIRCVREM